MDDKEFIEHFINYLEDGLPENILRDKSIVQRILNSMMGDNPQLNFNILSILRAWCRKMEIRIRIENDKRVQLNSGIKLRDCVSPFCVEFAIAASSFFQNSSLLPLACVTCNELISVAHAETPSIIVERAMEQIHIKTMQIPLLELISNSDSIIENLPIFDPILVINYPDLHRQLLSLSPTDQVEKYETIQKVYQKIQQINNFEIDIDRDLLYYCNIETLFDRAPAELFAGYPHPKVRKLFFSYAKQRKLDITQFSDTLICKNIFDPTVKDEAMQILKNQFESLRSTKLSHSQLAHLQCIQMKKNSNFMGQLCELINSSDNFTMVCSWIRFLYHKDEWIRDETSKILSDMLPFEVHIDLNEQPFNDHYVNRYKQYISNFKKCVENPLAESLFDTILLDEQPDFIKQIAASKLIEVLLDPSQGINKYFPKIRNLSFSKYPKLLHALSIRDGNWKIDSVERLCDLISSITPQNSMDLLPILARTVFQPLLIFEGNGSSLLKLPFFVEDNFHVKGAFSFTNEIIYEPIKEFEFPDILNDLVHFQSKGRKPICDGCNIPSLISLCLCDKVLAADLLCQLDDDESAVSKLTMTGQPAQIIYLLLISVLCSKTSSTAASILCEKYVDDTPSNAMKLNQALIEFGGDCKLPEKIVDYILNPNLRRVALSLVTTHIKFHKDVSSINFFKLVPLLEGELPINIKRQLMIMLVNLPKGQVDTDFMKQKDSIVKSAAFHFAALNPNHLEDAYQCIFGQNEAIISKATALEFIIMYYLEQKNFQLDRDITELYMNIKGENLFTLQLLRFLSFKQVRSQLMCFESFIVPYLSINSSELFVNAALSSLFGFSFRNRDIAMQLTKLASKKCYLHNIIIIISQLDQASLQLFDYQIITEICKHIKDDDICLSFICINHLILAGIEFPPKCVRYLLSVYDLFIDSTTLHHVLSQVFTISDDCKYEALKSGFLSLARNELVMYGENIVRFKSIWKTVSCFIYNFREGQIGLLDLWSIDTLIDFFDTSDTLLKFYLCYSYNNEVTQSSFCGALLDLVFEEFDKTRICSPLLLKLIATILNSEDVRRECYKQKRIQKFIPRLNYAVSHKEWGLCEGLLCILNTLSCYDDGSQELFDKNRITDIFINLLSNQNVIKLPIFAVLIRHLKSNSVTWRALTYATRKTNIELLNRLNQLSSADNCSHHRKE